VGGEVLVNDGDVLVKKEAQLKLFIMIKGKECSHVL
jgi:hypothetical protein